MHLRRLMCAVACIGLAAPAILMGQGAAQPAAAPSGPIAPADSLNGFVGLLQMEVVSAAEAMPAEKYDFAPPTTMGEFKGVRSFGSQVKHLAEANYEFFQGWTVPGATAVDPKTIEALKTKDDIVKALKDSYAYAHAAIATITPDNAFLAVQGFPKGTSTRVSMASFCAAHSMDHYGQLVEYLRMNGIVPPASRQQGSM
ncbi:MAG TPA: DinB family protein [Acidobacteriaceae bacterium]|jgi:hypothetical protein|nr:DinB family protein [Acidobacteriaceae bacterium]